MNRRTFQSPPHVCVIGGDDAAPEAMRPTVELLRELVPTRRRAVSGSNTGRH